MAGHWEKNDHKLVASMTNFCIKRAMFCSARFVRWDFNKHIILTSGITTECTLVFSYKVSLVQLDDLRGVFYVMIYKFYLMKERLLDDNNFEVARCVNKRLLDLSHISR